MGADHTYDEGREERIRIDDAGPGPGSLGNVLIRAEWPRTRRDLRRGVAPGLRRASMQLTARQNSRTWRSRGSNSCPRRIRHPDPWQGTGQRIYGPDDGPMRWSSVLEKTGAPRLEGHPVGHLSVVRRRPERSVEALRRLITGIGSPFEAAASSSPGDLAQRCHQSLADSGPA